MWAGKLRRGGVDNRKKTWSRRITKVTRAAKTESKLLKGDCWLAQTETEWFGLSAKSPKLKLQTWFAVWFKPGLQWFETELLQHYSTGITSAAGQRLRIARITE